MLRPAIIVPMHGERSKTPVYRAFYALAAPLLPALRRALPRYVTTTEHVGRAILAVARSATPPTHLENAEINGY